MSDLDGNKENRFSHDAAHISCELYEPSNNDLN